MDQPEGTTKFAELSCAGRYVGGFKSLIRQSSHQELGYGSATPACLDRVGSAE